MFLQDFEELKCQICLQLFDDQDRVPRILNCGHTFCNLCLMLILQHSYKLACPACRCETHKVVKEIAVNHVVHRLAFRIMFEYGSYQTRCCVSQQKGKPPKHRPHRYLSAGHCKEHDKVKELRCAESAEWLCCYCAVIEHGACRTMLVEDALNEMRVQILQKLTAAYGDIDFAANCVTEFYVSLDFTTLDSLSEEQSDALIDDIKWLGTVVELKCSISKIESVEKFLKDHEVMTSLLKYRLKEDNELTIAKQWHRFLTKEILKKWRKSDCDVYVMRRRKGVLLYGKIFVANDDSTWISKFVSAKPSKSSVILSFREILQQFFKPKKFPEKFYLQLAHEAGRKDGTIIIVSIDRHNSEQMKFVSTFCGLGNDVMEDSAKYYKEFTFKDLFKCEALTEVEEEVKDVDNKNNLAAKHGKTSPCDPPFKSKVIFAGFQELKMDCPNLENLSILDCGFMVN